MEELIKAMSNDDLETMKGKYADNASVVTLINGILGGRAKSAEQDKAKKQFESGVNKLFAKLPHPEDIMNIYVRWAEVEVPSGEAVEVEVVQPDNSKVMEMRQPTEKTWQWVVETNKGFQVRSGSGGKATTSKRAIKVFKRNGTQLEDMGNYVSASKACGVLGLTIGGDSATRVLARDGYILEPYEGTDYTA